MHYAACRNGDWGTARRCHALRAGQHDVRQLKKDQRGKNRGCRPSLRDSKCACNPDYGSTKLRTKRNPALRQRHRCSEAGERLGSGQSISHCPHCVWPQVQEAIRGRSELTPSIKTEVPRPEVGAIDLGERRTGWAWAGSSGVGAAGDCALSGGAACAGRRDVAASTIAMGLSCDVC